MLGIARWGQRVLKCFIASAFGREDVDSIYDKVVQPVLTLMNMKPLRVDRVEHNDDVDKKIIELINASDLALVDLTYARPSAYFEAGYAAGLGKPVIYMVRGDHFRARDSDPEGLLRVHFDLQVKNIIDWTSPNLDVAKRLEQRLRLVTAPLLKSEAQLEAIQSERVAFAKLAQIDSLDSMGEKIRAVLFNRGFSLEKAKSKGRYIPAPSRFRVYRDTSTGGQNVLVDCRLSVTKRDLERYRGVLTMRLSDRDEDSEIHLFLVTLKPVPLSRRQEALSDYQTLDDGAMYSSDYTDYCREHKQQVFVHFIDKVESISDMNLKLQRIISAHGFERHA